MKRIILLFLTAISVLWGCEKEGEIRPVVNPEHLYEIKDDPTDSIRHRVYEIYKEYGVSVFFNDTIGKVFVKVDAKGDSIFKYECLDPAWSFTGYRDLKYNYAYMTDPEEQSIYLNMIAEFLEKCSRSIYPYSIFVVNNYVTTDYRDTKTLYGDGDYEIYYKTLIITGDRNTALEEKPDEIIRSIIETRITDYKDLLSAFNRVSKDYINTSWVALGIDKLSMPFEFAYFDAYWGVESVAVVDEWKDYPLYSGTTCLSDSWWGFRDFDVEIIELCRKAVRAEIGKFGFVGSSIKKSYVSMPPSDTEDDLQVFIKEVMRYPRAEFERIWGGYPLVMQKYEILASIIEDKLGVTL